MSSPARSARLGEWSSLHHCSCSVFCPLSLRCTSPCPSARSTRSRSSQASSSMRGASQCSCWSRWASAALDLVVVRLMVASPRPRVRGLLVGLGVAANLGLLAYFKYANFAYANAEAVLAGWFRHSLPPLPAIALPIGVSFVVFEKITYIVDVYRGVGQPARRVRDYFLYVFLFPKLLAGPIIKYHDIAGQAWSTGRDASTMSRPASPASPSGSPRRSCSPTRWESSPTWRSAATSSASVWPGSVSSRTRYRSSSISRATPTWRLVWRACWGSGSWRISSGPIWRSASGSSGDGGTFRCRPGFATICISLWG